MAIFAIIFVALRLLPIFTAVERVSHYDELDLGVIAMEWLHGPRSDFWLYQMDPYGGESIVLGALAMPFVKILGPTLLAIKIPSLIFAVLTFCLTWIFLKRYFGRAAAVWGALLLIFCPPSFVQFSLAGLSGHAEALAFSVSALYFFYDFLFGSKNRVSIFLFGVLSGFGFWFYYENAILTASCLLSLPFLDRSKGAWPRAWHLLAGLLLGLVPWFAYLYDGSDSTNFTLSNVMDTLRNLAAPEFLWNKTKALFTEWLPFSFAFFPVLGIHERIYSAVYFFAAAIPLLVLAFKERANPKLLPFLLFPFVFAVLLIASYFSVAMDIGYIGYRYLAPLQFFMLLLLAALPVPRIYLGLLLLLGFLGQTSLMFQEPFGRVQKYKGTSYYRVGTQWFHTLKPENLGTELAKRNPDDAHFLRMGIESVGKEHPEILRLMWDSNTLFPRTVRERIGNLSPDEQTPFFRDLGRFVSIIHQEDKTRGLDWMENFPAEWKEEGLNGFRG